MGIGSISKVHGRLHSETQDVGQSIFFFEFQGAYPGWAEVLKQVSYDASPKITLLQS